MSLVVDDTVIFQDSEGRPGDLPDLILALSEHASVFGRGFREMKLAVEHEEANLHLLCEVRAVTQHRRGEPSAYVSVGGRLRDLEPRTGETAEAYRARVEPLAKDAGLLETARMQFQSFVGRLEAALHAALPEATVEEKRADAVVVRPTTQPTAPAAGSAQRRLRSVRHLLPEPDEHGAGRHADLVVHEHDGAAADDHGRPPVGRPDRRRRHDRRRIPRRSRRRPSIRATSGTTVRLRR